MPATTYTKGASVPDYFPHPQVRREHRPPAGTLLQPAAINGRQAEPWETEVQARGWQRERQAEAELVRVAPRPGVCTVCGQPWDGDLHCPCTKAAAR